MLQPGNRTRIRRGNIQVGKLRTCGEVSWGYMFFMDVTEEYFGLLVCPDLPVVVVASIHVAARYGESEKTL